MGFAPSSMTLQSDAFTSHGSIPTKHTGEGEDVSPALSWQSAPEGTKSFAVICHDPDAPKVDSDGVYGFAHWLIYNIPADTNELSEATDAHTHGKNDFGKSGYGGPMPPEGHGVHHYYFWIIALDTETNFEAGLTQTSFLKAVEPHIIGINRLIGTYER